MTAQLLLPNTSGLRLWGEYRVRLLGPDGSVRREERGHNLIVNTGLDLLLAQLVGSSSTPAIWFALGSSTTATDPTQTALVSENTTTGCVRLQAGVASGSSIAANPAPAGGHGIVQFTVLWTAAQNPNTTIGEVGVLTANTSGTLFSRWLVSPTIAKGASDGFQVVYAIHATAS